MRKTVSALVLKYFETTPRKIVPLGGGFYGRVFAIKINKEPYNIVVKLYLYPNFAANETKQLKILAEHSTVKMPEVYFTHLATEKIPHDAILMEYIEGENAGNINPAILEKNIAQIANEMIDNLISYHKTIHTSGFGEIGAGLYEENWEKYYFTKVRHTALL